jgi:hypothetical protein
VWDVCGSQCEEALFAMCDEWKEGEAVVANVFVLDGVWVWGWVKHMISIITFWDAIQRGVWARTWEVLWEA